MGKYSKMRKAVFLDRDGVINELMFNKTTNEYEPPHKIDGLEIIEGVIDSLHDLQDKNYELFIVSNQPDYAKGKTSLDNLKNVHDELHKIFVKENILFKEYYYCYHHPNGIIKEYSYDCNCRKPKPYFVLKAIKDHNIDPDSSWFVGDRDSDISCGRASGLKTILIENKYSEQYSGTIEPNFIVNNLSEATEKILNSDLIPTH